MARSKVLSMWSNFERRILRPATKRERLLVLLCSLAYVVLVLCVSAVVGVLYHSVKAALIVLFGSVGLVMLAALVWLAIWVIAARHQRSRD